MTTAIDSNVLIALWNEDDSLNTQARSALDAALGRGKFRTSGGQIQTRLLQHALAS